MNIFVGGWSGWPFIYDAQFKTHHLYSDVGAPSQLFSFIEMPAASINSGNFRVVPLTPSGDEMFSQDWPGIYHNGGSVVSFVDSHVEFKRWLEEDTKNIPLEAGSPTSMNSRMVSTDNRDLAWLRERATVPDPNTHNWFSFMGGIGRYHRDGNVRDVGGKKYVSWAWFWNSSW
jgi:prepilin-type processing-associated H-X9-DG protein